MPDLEYVAKRVLGNIRHHRLGCSLKFGQVLWAIQPPCVYCGKVGQNQWIRGMASGAKRDQPGGGMPPETAMMDAC